MDTELMTTEQVAQLLSVSEEYVRRLARDSRIPAIKLGEIGRRGRSPWRFWRSQVLEWIANGCPSQLEQPSLFRGRE